MNNFPLLGPGSVVAGFGTILWRADRFIQVASDDFALAVPKQLLKGRIAGYNRVINIYPDDCNRAHVHQGLKILPLAVGFQVQPSIFARDFCLFLSGPL